MSLDRVRISVVPGAITDVPPLLSILAQLEACATGVQAIAAAKASNAQAVAKRRAALQAGLASKAADHVDFAVALLRRRRGWVRISDLVAEIKAKRGADVHPAGLGKVLRTQHGLESEERQGRVCWRAKA